jgi:hypothetical protein
VCSAVSRPTALLRTSSKNKYEGKLNKSRNVFQDNRCINVRIYSSLSFQCNLFEKILKNDEFETMEEAEEDMNYLSSY